MTHLEPQRLQHHIVANYTIVQLTWIPADENNILKYHRSTRRCTTIFIYRYTMASTSQYFNISDNMYMHQPINTSNYQHISVSSVSMYRIDVSIHINMQILHACTKASGANVNIDSHHSHFQLFIVIASSSSRTFEFSQACQCPCLFPRVPLLVPHALLLAPCAPCVPACPAGAPLVPACAPLVPACAPRGKRPAAVRDVCTKRTPCQETSSSSEPAGGKKSKVCGLSLRTQLLST